jgi:hypothetical protein
MNEEHPMLYKTSDLKRCTIHATDGEIGRVKDLYFDDRCWVARWLVVDTGGWLSGREVLLPSSHLGHADAEAKTITVDLSRQKVKESPGVDTHQPVSRQQEQSIYGHYGWSPYWGGLAAMGAGAGYLIPPVYLMPGVGAPSKETQPEEFQRPEGDQHLRSTSEVRGYHIGATDGEIGHVDDFLVDGDDWAIRYMIVDTRNWWPGKLVLVAPEWGTDVSWNERMVTVRLTRDQIKGAPEFDGSRPLTRTDETRLYGHYGLAGYWGEAPKSRAMR